MATNRYADRMQSIGHLTRIAFRDFSSALGARFAKHGVTSGQWRFLRVLWEEDGITQRELSERVGAKEATTVRSVRSLLTSGLAERHDDADDARKFRIHLTARARRLEATLLPYVSEVHAIAERGIPRRDIETTRRVLVAMHKNFVESGTGAFFDEDRLV